MRVPNVGTTVLIDVTQDDIDHGVAGSCKECPISRAMLRTFPNMQHAETCGTFTEMYPKKKRFPTRYVLESMNRDASCNFVGQFDQHGRHRVSPITLKYKRTR